MGSFLEVRRGGSERMKGSYIFLLGALYDTHSLAGKMKRDKENWAVREERGGQDWICFKFLC